MATGFILYTSDFIKERTKVGGNLVIEVCTCTDVFLLRYTEPGALVHRMGIVLSETRVEGTSLFYAREEGEIGFSRACHRRLTIHEGDNR